MGDMRRPKVEAIPSSQQSREIYQPIRASFPSDFPLISGQLPHSCVLLKAKDKGTCCHSPEVSPLDTELGEG